MSETSGKGQPRGIISELKTCISETKLATVASLSPSSDDSTTLQHFISLSQLSSLFFFPIQIFELALRNKSNTALINIFSHKSMRRVSYKYGSGVPEKWYEWMPQKRRTKDAVQEAKTHAITSFNLKGKPLSALTPDDVICQITLGGWVHILKEWPDQTGDLHFWDKAVNQIFPHRGSVKRSEIFTQLQKLNMIRNRLFYHEPIWKDHVGTIQTLEGAYDSLEEKFKDLKTLIDWIFPDSHKSIDSLDTDFYKKTIDSHRKQFVNGK